MWYDNRRRLPFFGGHPASITKQSCNEIFDPKNLNPSRQSPYLVCEKTDGVRYLLVVAKVGYAELQREVRMGEEPPYTEFYLVSRQGHGRLTAYVVEIGLSHLLEAASTEVELERRSVVAVLDGELVKEKGGQIRYLVFDALVHLGRDICPLPLRERLECAASLLRCSEMLEVPPHRIEVRLKDFFRLTSPKFNIVEFMLKKYVKCLPHENDGIIFNHEEKPYLLASSNPGYIKWKPAHLNTVDFMVVPNLNLEEAVGQRVLDLYLAVQDQQLERYTRQFYAFAVVSEADFSKLQATYEENQMRSAQQEMEEQQGEAFTANEFAGAIIAECRFETTKPEERAILSKLHHIDSQQLCRDIMKQGDDAKDRKAIAELKNQVYEKNWKIYKLRADKSLPNNLDVARRIEESIRDGIDDPELIKKNDKLNKAAFLNQY